MSSEQKQVLISCHYSLTIQTKNAVLQINILCVYLFYTQTQLSKFYFFSFKVDKK